MPTPPCVETPTSPTRDIPSTNTSSLIAKGSIGKPLVGVSK